MNLFEVTFSRAAGVFIFLLTNVCSAEQDIDSFAQTHEGNRPGNIYRQRRDNCIIQNNCFYCKGQESSEGEAGSYDRVTCFISAGSNFSSTLDIIPLVKNISLRCTSGDSSDLKNLDQKIFERHSSTLQNLQIISCIIGALPSNTFTGLVTLQRLELLYTGLETRYLQAIGGISTAASVKLLLNDLTILDSRSFGNVISNVSVLDLSYNNVQRIGNNTFMGFHSLKKLFLGNNNISAIEGDAFRGLPSLSVLSLRYNPNTVLITSTCAVRSLSQLSLLDVSETGLRNLSEVTCAPLPTLRHLFLQGNGLEQIPEAAFQSLPRLTSLDLSRNSIISVHGAAFVDGSTHLTEVDLSHNLLLELSPSLFSHSLNIIHANLSYNLLTVVRIGTFSGLPSLESVDLSFNHIYSIEAMAFVAVDNLHFIDLRSNNLTSYPESLVTFIGTVIPPHDRMDTLLAGNAFSCGCDTMFLIRMGRFADYFPALSIPDNGTWVCSAPPPTEGKRMVSVPLANFWCPIPYEGICPEACTCYMRDIDKEHVLFCSNAAHKRLPEIPQNTAIFNCTHCLSEELDTLEPGDLTAGMHLEELVLRDVGLSAITAGALVGLENLQQVDFSGNALKFVDNVLFPYSSNLSLLDLSHNQLSTISQIAFEGNPNLEVIRLHSNSLETLEDGVFNYSLQLQSLTLHDNPFICNCSLFWLKQWLQSNLDSIENIYDVECYVNSSTLDMFPVIQVVDQDFGCHGSDVQFLTTQQYTAVIATTLLMSLFLIVFAVAFRHRRAIRVILYTRYGFHLLHDNDDVLAEELRWEYDAYIAYSDDDFDFVLRQLLPMLEGHANRYKLCVRHRDFAPGGCMATTIVNSVGSSRRSIILLSRSFLQDEWRLLEFKTAHQRVLKDKRNKNLIVIFLDDIAKDELNDDMSYYVTANAFLRHRDRLFREKLMFEMPRNPLGAKDGDPGQQEVIALQI